MAPDPTAGDEIGKTYAQGYSHEGLWGEGAEEERHEIIEVPSTTRTGSPGGLQV